LVQLIMPIEYVDCLFAGCHEVCVPESNYCAKHAPNIGRLTGGMRRCIPRKASAKKAAAKKAPAKKAIGKKAPAKKVATQKPHIKKSIPK